MISKFDPLVRVLVADDHRMVREGIRTMLKEARSRRTFEVREAESSEEAVQKALSEDYQVVLMDFHLPGRGGAKATELILARRPDIAVLAISSYGERVYVDQMIAAGALGYILKNIEPDTLAEAIRTVMAGKYFYSNEIAVQLIDDKVRPGARDPLASLTSREREVFQEILQGKPNRVIAQKLHVDKRTVDKHRENLMAKLGVKNAMELAKFGIRLGLLKGL